MSKLLVAVVCSTLLCFTQFDETLAYKCYLCRGKNCHMKETMNFTIKCNPDEPCVSVFEGLKILERGCYSLLPQHLQEKCETPGNNDCHICSHNYCNNRGPAMCVECDWKHQGSLCFYNSHIIKPTYCPRYESGTLATTCFIRRSLHKKRKWANIERGCVTNETPNLHCKNDDDMKECIFCNASAGTVCNTDLLSTDNFISEPKAVLYNKYARNGIDDNSDTVLVILLICFCYVVSQFFFHL